MLERALLAAHADLAAPFFAASLAAYFETLAAPADAAEAGGAGGAGGQTRGAGGGAAEAAAVRARFEQVRARGRKRLAFG